MGEEEGFGKTVQSSSHVRELVGDTQEEVTDIVTDRHLHRCGAPEPLGPDLVVVGKWRGPAPLYTMGDIVGKHASQPESYVADVSTQRELPLPTGSLHLRQKIRKIE